MIIEKVGIRISQRRDNILRKLNQMKGFAVMAEDGECGEIDDFYFDDVEMGVRYAVVDTGSWLEDREVLLSPESFIKPDFGREVFPVELTQEEIEESPPVAEEEPLSRQLEKKLVEYYNWPSYWVASVNPPGMVYHPRALPLEVSVEREQVVKGEDDLDTSLRSAREIEGYNIKAADGQIGHLDDFIVDEESWLIRYLLVDTRNWLPGKKVILAPEWLERISWNKEQLVFEMTKEQIKNAPEFDPDIPTDRVYEEKLYDFYEREKYWD